MLLNVSALWDEIFSWWDLLSRSYWQHASEIFVYLGPREKLPFNEVSSIKTGISGNILMKSCWWLAIHHLSTNMRGDIWTTLWTISTKVVNTAKCVSTLNSFLMIGLENKWYSRKLYIILHRDTLCKRVTWWHGGCSRSCIQRSEQLELRQNCISSVFILSHH